MEDIQPVDKNPSIEFINLVQEWAESFIKSSELPSKILELGQKEGLDNKTIREAIESALTKRGLSKDRIIHLIPSQLKRLYVTNIQKSAKIAELGEPKPLV